MVCLGMFVFVFENGPGMNLYVFALCRRPEKVCALPE